MTTSSNGLVLPTTSTTNVDYSTLNPNGPTPYNSISSAAQPSSGGFVSSAQPVINTNTNTGLANGMNTVNGGSTGSNPSGQTQASTQQSSNGTQGLDPVTSMFQNYSQQVGQVLSSTVGNQTGAAQNVYNATLQNAQLANQSIQLQYNTGLGQLNTQYNQQFQTLQTQHAQAVGSATAAIAAADPLGMQGGSFASGYVGKINDLFSQQASFLTAAYGQQQQALANGEMESTLGIQQQINTAQANFGQQLASIQSGAMQSLLQLGQTGLGIAQFEQSRQLQSQSLFESTLKGTNLLGVALPDGNSLFDTTTGKPNVTIGDLTGDNGQPTPEGSSFISWLSGTSMYQQGIQAGYTPQQIAQAVLNGTSEQYNSYLSNKNLQLETAKAYSAGAVGGSGSSTDTSNLSPLGQSIMQSSGGASLTYAKGGDSVMKTLNDVNEAATSDNINGMLGFVNSGDSNAFSSVLGPVMNGFFGTDFGSTLTSKDYVAAGSLLGVDGSTLENLANQPASTRAQVVSQILTKLQSKLKGTVSTYQNSYNLQPLASSISTSESNITQALNQLQGSGSSVAGQPSASSYMSSVGGSYDPGTALNSFLNFSGISK